MVLTIRTTLWSSYVKLPLNAITTKRIADFQNSVTRLWIIVFIKNDDQFAKYCQTPRNHRFQKVICCWSSQRHFGALTVKFALNPIVAQNMANFQNTVTGVFFTVFQWSICAYHVSNILESLLWNFYLTKLRLIRWTVLKILSHA